MVYPLESNVTWISGFDDMTTYNFGPEKIDHSFCSVCGTSICAMSNDPSFFADNRAINVSSSSSDVLMGLGPGSGLFS